MRRLLGISPHAPGLGSTRITRPVAWLLTLLFLATIYAVPLLDGIAGRWSGTAAAWRMAWERVARTNDFHQGPFAGVMAWNGELLAGIDAAETALEEDSLLAEWIRPPGMDFLLTVLRAGSEEAYVGRGGWLFYRPDVDFVVGRALQRRLAPEHGGDGIKSVEVIASFAHTLALQGVRLVLVPTPGKASIEPERFVRGAFEPPVLPRGHDQWRAALERELDAVFSRSHGDADPKLRTVVVDAAGILAAEAENAPQYLKTDSHWTPEGMEAVARAVAERLGPPDENAIDYRVATRTIEGVGDTAAMLGLPEDSRWLAPERIEISQVKNPDGSDWSADQTAEILLLGDSFSNIYSAEALGWGSAAGLAEQIARISGRAVDRLVRNDGGASATRRMLATMTARAPERWKPKTVVIWQFAERELAFGKWENIELNDKKHIDQFISVSPEKDIEVVGTIAAVGTLPRPAGTPYADYLTAYHLTDVEGGGISGGEAIAYVFTMRDHERLPAANLGVGTRVRAVLTNWDAQEERLGSLNRGELDDPDLLFEPPNFAREFHAKE